MDEPEEKRELTGFQRVAYVFMGLTMIATGLVTVFWSDLFNPHFPAWAVWAPFAFAGGGLLVAVGIRGGRRS